MSGDNFFSGDTETYFEDDADTGASPNTFIIAAIAGGIGLIIGSFIWNVYSDGLRTKHGELPIIKADLEQYKFAPAATNTVGIPQSDLRVLDPKLRAEDQEKHAGQPVTMDLDAAIEASNGSASGLGGPPIAISQTPDSPSEYTRQSTPVQTATLRPINTGTTAVDAADANPQNTSLTVMAPTPTARAQAPLSTPKFTPNGAYLVQLAAVRSEASANALWKKKLGEHPDLLDGASPYIQRADLDARGTWYRLKVDGFSARADAKAFCETLKTRGVDCLVTQR